MMLVARNIETFVYSLEPKDSPRAKLARSFGANYVSAGDVPLSDLASRTGSLRHRLRGRGNRPGRVRRAGRARAQWRLHLQWSARPAKSRSRSISTASCATWCSRTRCSSARSMPRARRFEASVRQLEQFMTLFPDAVRGLITERVPLRGGPLAASESGRHQTSHFRWPAEVSPCSSLASRSRSRPARSASSWPPWARRCARTR